jgi:hypothetical protein
MGTLIPIATILGTVASVGLQAAQGVAAHRQAAAQSRAQAVQYQVRQQEVAADDTALTAEAARRREIAQEDIGRLRRDQADSDRLRRNALRRAVAKRRAALGAKGIDATAGSGEALLLGLVDDSALKGSQEHRRTGDRVAEIRRDLDYRQRLNLLERSRLQGRYRLNQAAYQADLREGRTRSLGRARDTLDDVADGIALL